MFVLGFIISVVVLPVSGKLRGTSESNEHAHHITDNVKEFRSHRADSVTGKMLDTRILFDQLSSDTASTCVTGCTNYSHGTSLSRELRQQNLSNYVDVLFVDKKEDRMCFHFLNSSVAGNMSNKLDFTIPRHSESKIHDSVHHFMESSGNVDTLTAGNSVDITIHYSKNVFEVPDLAADYFRTVINALSNYEHHAFEKVVFSSDSTARFFERNSRRLSSADLVKHHSWRYAAEVFQSVVSPQSESDLCGYKTLAALDLAAHKGKMVLPLQRLLSTEDELLAQVCVAHMAAALSQDPAVRHIALTNSPQYLNFRVRSIQQTASVGQEPTHMPYSAAGLLGDGQVVAISDSGLDLNSCYFWDTRGEVPFSDMAAPVTDGHFRKVVQYTYGAHSDIYDTVGGHGTHVSGVAAGNNMVTTDGTHNGMAPNAKIAFMDLVVPNSGMHIPPVAVLYQAGYDAGARVFTNSWGVTYNGPQYYTTHDVDELLFNNMDVAIFFAAGNSGGEGSDGKSTVTMEAGAKNVIAVGSSQTTLGTTSMDYVSWFSSKGPTFDGRVKPDIVAPGEQVLSAKSNEEHGLSCEVMEQAGTSMASPAAAGTALLVRQYFMDTQNRFWTKMCSKRYRNCHAFSPSGVLLKALLVHSGSDMTWHNGGVDRDVPLGPPPDNMQGFGRVTLKNVLPLPGVADFDLFVDDLVAIGESSERRYMVKITKNDPVMPIKVTATWYDPPAVDGITTKSLLHDLDLTVTAPDGTLHLGNGGRYSDSVNTIEKVVVESPRAGSWDVVVNSNALPVTGSQRFSIVITSAGKVVYA